MDHADFERPYKQRDPGEMAVSDQPDFKSAVSAIPPQRRFHRYSSILSRERQASGAGFLRTARELLADPADFHAFFVKIGAFGLAFRVAIW